MDGGTVKPFRIFRRSATGGSKRKEWEVLFGLNSAWFCAFLAKVSPFLAQICGPAEGLTCFFALVGSNEVKSSARSILREGSGLSRRGRCEGGCGPEVGATPLVTNDRRLYPFTLAGPGGRSRRSLRCAAASRRQGGISRWFGGRARSALAARRRW